MHTEGNIHVYRKFYLKINNEISEWQTSKVGIPQGSVLSPSLCNLYTSDAMEKIRSKLHSEFADDNTILSHGTDMDEVVDEVTKDCDVIPNIQADCTLGCVVRT